MITIITGTRASAKSAKAIELAKSRGVKFRVLVPHGRVAEFKRRFPGCEVRTAKGGWANGARLLVFLDAHQIHSREFYVRGGFRTEIGTEAEIIIASSPPTIKNHWLLQIKDMPGVTEIETSEAEKLEPNSNIFSETIPDCPFTFMELEAMRLALAALPPSKLAILAQRSDQWGSEKRRSALAKIAELQRPIIVRN